MRLCLYNDYNSNMLTKLIVAKVRSCSTRTALFFLTEVASSDFRYRLHIVQQSRTNPVRQNDVLRSKLYDQYNGFYSHYDGGPD